MSTITISGNAFQFNTLLACIGASAGKDPAHNVAKADVYDRILALWPELDPRGEMKRIDDQSQRAKEVRQMNLETDEQGALAEAFLAHVKAGDTKTATFIVYRDAARMIQVSKWWNAQTRRPLPHFKHQDEPIRYSDEAAEKVVAQEAMPA